jgi:thiol-disulfide isomerase/thioredoxin
MSSTRYRGWLTSAIAFAIVGCADATPDATLESETVDSSRQELQVEDAELERPVTTEPGEVGTAATTNEEEQTPRDNPEEEDILVWNPHEFITGPPAQHPDWTSTPASDGTPRYSVAFVDSPLLIFCEFMGGQLDQPIWIRGGIPSDQTRITLTVKDKPIEELFEMALSPHGLRMQKHGDGWRVVGIDEPAESGEYPVNFSSPERTRTLVGESIPAITGTSVGTAELPTMKELSGKVVLVSFWATWCPPCVEAVPDIDRLQQKYRERGLVVVAVHTQRRSDKLVDFLEANPVEFPVVRDDGETADRFALFALPMYVLVGRSGTVVNEYQGALPDDTEIEAELDRTDTSSAPSGG